MFSRCVYVFSVACVMNVRTIFPFFRIWSFNTITPFILVVIICNWNVLLHIFLTDMMNFIEAITHFGRNSLAIIAKLPMVCDTMSRHWTMNSRKSLHWLISRGKSNYDKWSAMHFLHFATMNHFNDSQWQIATGNRSFWFRWILIAVIVWWFKNCLERKISMPTLTAKTST